MNQMEGVGMHTKKKLLVYLVIPVGVSLALMGMYFSGNIVLQRIVVPKLPPLSPDDWREFGLLENLQNVLWIAFIAAAAAGACRKTWCVERAAFLLLTFGAVFMLLEETDYGTLYHGCDTYKKHLAGRDGYDMFAPRREWPPELVAQIPDEESFTVHNRLDITGELKRVNDVLFVAFFGLLPLIAWRMKRPWLDYIAPERWAIATLIAIFLLRTLTHTLGDWEAQVIREAQAAGNAINRERGAISSNLSEFRELNTYYLYLVHCITVVFLRRSPAQPPEEETRASNTP